MINGWRGWCSVHEMPLLSMKITPVVVAVVAFVVPRVAQADGLVPDEHACFSHMSEGTACTIEAEDRSDYPIGSKGTCHERTVEKSSYVECEGGPDARAKGGGPCFGDVPYTTYLCVAHVRAQCSGSRAE